jgi:hypothetical protein
MRLDKSEYFVGSRKKPMRRAKAVAVPEPSETQIQQQFIQYLDLCAHRDLVYYAIPNGGGRSKVEGARLKKEGVRAGVPDVYFLFKGVSHYIEIKKKKGRLSPEQKVMIERLRAAGGVVEVAYGLDACINQTKLWGMVRQ